MNKHIILCADDYGLSPSVDAGILALVRAGRLSAVSCMTQAPGWPESARALEGLDADLGLHFNLTHPFGQTAHYGLGMLMLNSVVRHIPAALIRASLTDQLDRFEAATGRPPDFVDGHQHVHAFAGIRTALLDVLATRYPSRRPWLRSVTPLVGRHDAGVKARVLGWFTRGFGPMAQAAGFAVPPAFSGLYSLTAEAGYAELMADWLACVPEGCLLMCHPAVPDNDGVADVIREARIAEFMYLQGDAFTIALQNNHTYLARYRRAHTFLPG